MNLQLHRVISDITGTTGMAIIRAIVTGERNPDVLASHKDGRVKASCAEIAAALTGDYRPEMVFILQQELQLYDFFQIQISACDAQIEQCLASFGSKVDVNASPLAKPKRRGKKQPGNAPQFDLRSELYRMSGVDFTQIDGLGAVSVLTLISELGLDATRFPLSSTLRRGSVYALVVALLAAKLKVLNLVELSTALPPLYAPPHNLFVALTLLWVAFIAV
ncbi:MAG: hypothetical protein N4J56_000046 [Chroococcidiopsis sp. SAG 2025]|nr:hypothetical protein [Chroococcidiopsis sp. SAG 2025]